MVAVAGAIVAGVLACFVIDVFVAASGVPDCFVATDRVAVPIGVWVGAGTSVALSVGVAGSIVLGRGEELASAVGVAVGLSVGGSGVDVIRLSEVGTSGP